MTDPEFIVTYRRAAALYLGSDLKLDVVEDELGGDPNWPVVKRMLRGIEAAQPHSVPGETTAWFRPRESHEYWPAHLDLLVDRKGWGDEAVQSIDLASTRVVNHLFDPATSGRCNRHGLVIGHVQSGKTANYTAVIAKAADAGYQLIIVLTGLYNDLRDQTQSRISKELVGSLEDPDAHDLTTISFQEPWQEETRVGRDFHDIEFHPPPRPNGATIAVIKKNVSPLERILEWTSGFDNDLRRTLNVLIIDDESDHASVNTMSGEEIDEYRQEPQRSPSRINELLRRLIKSLPRVAYVGYTATPFANVFIDPDEADEELGATLYPKDFIVSLPKPRGHFGLAEVFPDQPSEADNGNVVVVPQDQADVLRALTAAELPTTALPDAMEAAVMDYLLAGAARRTRGDGGGHHTMMVHTKHTIRSMKPLVRRLRLLLQDHWTRLLKSRSRKGKARLAEFEARWSTQFAARGCPEPWEVIRPALLSLLTDEPPAVYEINMDSEDQLDFDRYRGRGLWAIAVGGNRLSRGLTLEGLSVTLFVRPSTTHDTLMQMSRWFGFRGGYTDLVRVHVTAEINERFTGMGRVERELRDDLERYELQTEVTPADFGVRVLKQENVLPTRPGARRNVRTMRANAAEDQKMFFTGRFSFADAESLRTNLRRFAAFLPSEPGAPVGPGGGSWLWRGVPAERVRDLIRDLDYPDHTTWPTQRLCNHITDRLTRTPDELRSWSVAVVGLQSGTPAAPLAPFDRPNVTIVQPRRTRLAHSNSVGTLPGSWDFTIDLDQPRSSFAKPGSTGFDFNRMWEHRPKTTPLLLAYIVDPTSSVGASGGREATLPRTDLFHDTEEPVDLLGLALVFPRAEISPEERALAREFWIRGAAAPFPGL